MSANDLMVAGRRFRTQADYEAALRDQKKIDIIRAKTDLDNPKQLYKLFGEMQSGTYRFETVIGNDFDDEIFERIEKLKRQGITAENAESTVGKKNRKSRQGQRSTERKPAKVKREKSSKKTPEKLEDYDKNMQEQILGELKRQERKRRTIVILASIVAALSFGYFGVYYFYMARTNLDYESLAELKEKNSNYYNIQETVKVHKTSNDMPDILPEYQMLYEKNKKLIGWLRIDDTIIDYPVMQTSNNEYYLDHNYNQEYDKNGSLFLDKDCDAAFPNDNMIIYGHHMKSGKMFGNLNYYSKESFWEDNKEFTFDTIYETGTYAVMYVFRSKIYSEEEIVFKYYQFIDATSENEFNSNMEEMANMSLYDTGVTASYGDRLITLSTCDSSEEDGRFVVVAKKIK